ncbi:MAG: hypothetical protein BMS9Abin36_0566 [Gammaproteobacteria bacterium]|nr:MAG: hypothetical protein BMS9Abin36_0566 [Gammaproteobacteria bacterium]
MFTKLQLHGTWFAGLSLACLAISACNAAPVLNKQAPMLKRPVLLQQPDGYSFTVIGHGDERRIWYETPDGYSVKYSAENQSWFYARCDQTRLLASEYLVGHKLPADWPKHLRPSFPNCGKDSSQP